MGGGPGTARGPRRRTGMKRPSASVRRALRLTAGVALAGLLVACSAVGASPSRRVGGTEVLSSPSATSFVVAPPSVEPHAGIAGRVLAGPTCPVERVPPDPACAQRGIVGAVIVVTGGGAEVARVTSGLDGTYAVQLPPGTYTLTPQPVQGLLGVAPPAQATIPAEGDGPTVDFTYDTGIR